jgi:hypothetical protein
VNRRKGKIKQRTGFSGAAAAGTCGMEIHGTVCGVYAPNGRFRSSALTIQAATGRLFWVLTGSVGICRGGLLPVLRRFYERLAALWYWLHRLYFILPHHCYGTFPPKHSRTPKLVDRDNSTSTLSVCTLCLAKSMRVSGDIIFN